MSFVVLEFLKEKTVEVVPDVWLSQDKKECYWPTYRNSFKVTALVKKRILPETTWETLGVKVLGYADTYASAQTKRLQAEDTPELDSDVGPLRKRVRAKRYNSSYSGKTGDASSLQHKRKMNTPVKKPSFPSSQNMKLEIGNDYVASPSAGEAQEVNESDQEALGRKIVSMLVEVQHNVKILDRITGLESDTKDVLSAQADDELPDFPLSSDEELQYVENSLTEKSFFINLVRYLRSLGGRNVDDSTRIIMNSLLGKKLAIQYSLYGTTKKRSFSNLRLMNVVCSAVQEQHRDYSEKELRRRVMRFLIGASDRDGGRWQRQRGVPINDTERYKTIKDGPSVKPDATEASLLLDTHSLTPKQYAETKPPLQCEEVKNPQTSSSDPCTVDASLLPKSAVKKRRRGCSSQLAISVAQNKLLANYTATMLRQQAHCRKESDARHSEILGLISEHQRQSLAVQQQMIDLQQQMLTMIQEQHDQQANAATALQERQLDIQMSFLEMLKKK